MVYYRQREGSIMVQAFSEKRLHVLEAWKEKRDYFEEHNLKELAQRTDCSLCWILKNFYVQAQETELVNKKEMLKQLKKDMRQNYVRYIKNPFITVRGKVTLTLCLLNGQVFFKIYEKYTEKKVDFREE